MNILVTGGAGYIGTHTVVELIKSGHSVVVIDDLSNSSPKAIERVEQITETSIPFYTSDIRDEKALDDIFSQHTIDAVIHFAGLKAVGESTEKPLLYYQVNVGGALSLFKTMEKHGVTQLVFSSTATVYGSAPIPYKESGPVGEGITNTYGRTKYMIEQVMRDIAAAHPTVRYTALRYFNPIGAHPSGLIGEYPNGIPNNVMPYITQVATGQREALRIFGSDYDTVDGTGVRDYIHVVDLARGHVAALEHNSDGFTAYNLGSGKGVSVLELVKAFETASGKTLPYILTDRRAGDLPEFYADASLAAEKLQWHTEKNIEEACRDSWIWIKNNPHGYEA